jgi:hypothetical protein
MTLRSTFSPMLLAGLLGATTALGFAACGEDGAALGDCPTNSTTQQLAGRRYIEATCAVAGCHGGGGSSGGVNLSTLAGIQTHAGSSYAEASSGSMPPGGVRTSSATLEAMRIFLACGAPDVK